MRNHHLLYIICILTIIAFSKCANQSQPTGGPKDTLAPIIVKTLPANKSLNFKGDKIELVFNEYIKIENIKKQLIITPRLEKEYEYKIIKNRIELEFESKLEPNTTYTFNFRDAIKDITEGNKAQNVVLVFSTGNYLDSLSIEGTITNLLNGKKSKDYTVALYENVDTINLFTSMPKYFAKTDTAGYYKIQNLKDGDYKMYTFEDKNDNLICEPHYEAYGFKSEPFKLSQINNVDLVTYNSDVREYKRMSANPFTKYYEIRLNKYTQRYELTNDYNELIYSSLEDKNRNIRIYNTLKEGTDSLKIYLKSTDSIGSILQDTLYVKFRKSRGDSDKMNVKYQLNDNTQIQKALNFSIDFNKPIKSINLDSIIVYYDSMQTEKISAKDIDFNFNKTSIRFNKSLDITKVAEQQTSNTTSTQNTAAARPERTKSIEPREADSKSKVQPKNNNFRIYFGKGAFISVEDDSSSVTTKNLKPYKPNNAASGIIKGKITTDSKSFIVQLLNKSNEIVEEQKNESNFQFKELVSGDYFIRVLIDTNNNGEWDLGNINENIEPEPILHWPSKITLRANWERDNINLSYKKGE